jgi:hypothetical protein
MALVDDSEVFFMAAAATVFTGCFNPAATVFTSSVFTWSVDPTAAVFMWSVDPALSVFTWSVDATAATTPLLLSGLFGNQWNERE